MSKNYVIAGGSTGIGFALAKHLVESGNSVTVLSRTKGELDTLSGVNHITHDVTSETVPEIAADTIDGFVYCPGTINLKPFHGIKPKAFQQDFDVNVLGAVKLTQAVLKQLKAAPKASIVYFSTVAVSQGMPYHASVAASKGAIEGMTRSLAAELAPAIRVNCIAPSITDTPLASRILSNDDKKEAAGKRHALGRVGSAAEIAKAAAYLLSEDAAWITGQVLGIDGGMSAIRPL